MNNNILLKYVKNFNHHSLSHLIRLLQHQKNQTINEMNSDQLYRMNPIYGINSRKGIRNLASADISYFDGSADISKTLHQTQTSFSLGISNDINSLFGATQDVSQRSRIAYTSDSVVYLRPVQKLMTQYFYTSLKLWYELQKTDFLFNCKRDKKDGIIINSNSTLKSNIISSNTGSNAHSSCLKNNEEMLSQRSFPTYGNLLTTETEALSIFDSMQARSLENVHSLESDNPIVLKNKILKLQEEYLEQLSKFYLDSMAYNAPDYSMVFLISLYRAHHGLSCKYLSLIRDPHAQEFIKKLVDYSQYRYGSKIECNDTFSSLLHEIAEQYSCFHLLEYNWESLSWYSTKHSQSEALQVEDTEQLEEEWHMCDYNFVETNASSEESMSQKSSNYLEADTCKEIDTEQDNINSHTLGSINLKSVASNVESSSYRIDNSMHIKKSPKNTLEEGPTNYSQTTNQDKNLLPQTNGSISNIMPKQLSNQVILSDVHIDLHQAEIQPNIQRKNINSVSDAQHILDKHEVQSSQKRDEAFEQLDLILNSLPASAKDFGKFFEDIVQDEDVFTAVEFYKRRADSLGKHEETCLLNLAKAVYKANVKEFLNLTNYVIINRVEFLSTVRKRFFSSLFKMLVECNYNQAKSFAKSVVENKPMDVGKRIRLLNAITTASRKQTTTTLLEHISKELF